jgi:hypothetical protein
MEPEGSLCSWDPATGPSPEADETISHFPTVCQIFPNIIPHLC